jgi:imidazolonepropionase-like amidohydrolase
MARDRGLVALRADRMVDVAAGEVRQGRVVLVRGERIQAVLGPGHPLPEGTAVVDLPGAHAAAGLIDCHTHLVGRLQGSGIPAIDRSAAQEALDGFGNAGATVLAGFTSPRRQRLPGARRRGPARRDPRRHRARAPAAARPAGQRPSRSSTTGANALPGASTATPGR